MLRKRSEGLKAEEKKILAFLFKASPLPQKVYRLREKLTRIFDRGQTEESGERAIRRCMAEVKASGLGCFDQFLVTSEK